jgi:hypothetical protein
MMLCLGLATILFILFILSGNFLFLMFFPSFPRSGVGTHGVRRSCVDFGSRG